MASTRVSDASSISSSSSSVKTFSYYESLIEKGASFAVIDVASLGTFAIENIGAVIGKGGCHFKRITNESHVDYIYCTGSKIFIIVDDHSIDDSSDLDLDGAIFSISSNCIAEAKAMLKEHVVALEKAFTAPKPAEPVAASTTTTSFQTKSGIWITKIPFDVDFSIVPLVIGRGGCHLKRIAHQLGVSNIAYDSESQTLVVKSTTALDEYTYTNVYALFSQHVASFTH